MRPVLWLSDRRYYSRWMSAFMYVPLTCRVHIITALLCVPRSPKYFWENWQNSFRRSYPILLYDLETWPLKKSDFRSLDFTTKQILQNNQHGYCQAMSGIFFNFELPSLGTLSSKLKYS